MDRDVIVSDLEEARNSIDAALEQLNQPYAVPPPDEGPEIRIGTADVREVIYDGHLLTISAQDEMPDIVLEGPILDRIVKAVSG